MTSLRKKEPLCPDNLPIDDNWHVATGQRDGKPMFVRSHTGYREFKGVTGYEHQIGIAVPLRDPMRMDCRSLPRMKSSTPSKTQSAPCSKPPTNPCLSPPSLPEECASSSSTPNPQTR